MPRPPSASVHGELDGDPRLVGEAWLVIGRCCPHGRRERRRRRVRSGDRHRSGQRTDDARPPRGDGTGLARLLEPPARRQDPGGTRARGHRRRAGRCGTPRQLPRLDRQGSMAAGRRRRRSRRAAPSSPGSSISTSCMAWLSLRVRRLRPTRRPPEMEGQIAAALEVSRGHPDVAAACSTARVCLSLVRDDLRRVSSALDLAMDRLGRPRRSAVPIVVCGLSCGHREPGRRRR